MGNRRWVREQAAAALTLDDPVPPAELRPPSSAQLMTRLTRDVDRLTLSTAPPAAGPGRQLVTVPPLLTDLRESMRPDQGGTRKGASRGGALPIDAAAADLYRTVEREIRETYIAATDSAAVGPPEQLLQAWLGEFRVSFRTGDVTHVQLIVATARTYKWRTSIENYLTPPLTADDPLCPRCGFTHYLTMVDGQVVQRHCVTRMVWPEQLARLPRAKCGHCGAKWIGIHRHPKHPDRAALSDLDDEIRDNITEYGDLTDEPIVAPLKPLQDRLDEETTP